MISSLYIDNSIPAGPDKAVIHAPIKQLNEHTIKAMSAVQQDLTVSPTMADLLESDTQKQANEYHLIQPKIIQTIMDDLQRMKINIRSKNIPMDSSKILSPTH